jgi:hypothetical protein
LSESSTNQYNVDVLNHVNYSCSLSSAKTGERSLSNKSAEESTPESCERVKGTRLKISFEIT